MKIILQWFWCHPGWWRVRWTCIHSDIQSSQVYNTIKFKALQVESISYIWKIWIRAYYLNKWQKFWSWWWRYTYWSNAASAFWSSVPVLLIPMNLVGNWKKKNHNNSRTKEKSQKKDDNNYFKNKIFVKPDLTSLQFPAQIKSVFCQTSSFLFSFLLNID